MFKIGFIKTDPDVKVPKSQSKWAACFDLYANHNVELWPGETMVIGTGIKLDMHKSKKGLIYSRSGLASQGIVVANSPGVIDPDYQGEVKVLLHYQMGYFKLADIQLTRVDPFLVRKGDRIAQLEIVPRHNEFIELVEVEDFSIHPTERGEKGLGSTGI